MASSFCLNVIPTLRNIYVFLFSRPEFHLTVPEAKNIVIIVEDDSEIIDTYQKNIEEKLPYFEVHSVKNGYDAIRLIRKLLPTIIITEHDMPLMDGYQLVEAMNKRESGKNIPVIVITNNTNDELKKSYAKLGVDKILSKPADIDKLIEAMKECLFQS